jgi:hypothetical protein
MLNWSTEGYVTLRRCYEGHKLSLEIIHSTVKNKNHNSGPNINLVCPLLDGFANEDEKPCNKVGVPLRCGEDT